MTALFDFDASPDRYAVMGNPVAHSQSPRIHHEFARQTGHSMTYEAIQVDEGGFRQAVGNFRAAGGKGLNITVPFKQDAWALADERSERAERAGAVNTIMFLEADRIFGDNTDGIGLVRDIVTNHSINISGKRVLILGAGGAVRGILSPLLAENPSEVVIANRTADKAEALAREYSVEMPVQGCGFGALGGLQFDLVINGTAASLHGVQLPLPNGILAGNAACYDMMYGASAASFLNWGRTQGASRLFDGLGMLVEQAAESFYIWRGVRPVTAPVMEMLRT